MVSSFVAGLLLFTTQEVKRDFKFPVMSVSALGNRLGKDLNRLVIVSPEVRDRLVYVHLRDRTYAELYQFLEESIFVKVIDRNGALTIADSGREFTDTYMSEEAVLEQISSSIRDFPDRDTIRKNYKERDSITTKLISGQVSGQEYAALSDRRDQLQIDDPINQAGFRFARDLGWEGMMQLPQMERIVFSTKPTSMQRKWIGDSVSLIKEISESLSDRAEIKAEIESQRGGLLSANSQAVAEIRAVVRRYPAFLLIDTKFYASDGSLISSGQVSINGSSEKSNASDQMMDAIERIVRGMTGDIQLSPEDIKELELLRTFATLLAKKLNTDQLEWLSTIDEDEPLGGVYSEVYDHVLEELGREAVFSISPQSSLRISEGKLTVESAFRSTLWGAKIEGLEDDAKVLIRQRGQNTRATVSRTPLAEMARRLLANGKLTLFDLSELSAMVEDDSQVSKFIREMLISSGQADGNSNVAAGSFIEFFILAYSKLPLGVRRQMESGGYGNAIKNLVQPLPQTVVQALHNSELGVAAKTRYKIDSHGELVRQAPENWPSSVPFSDWMQEQTEFLVLKEFSPISLQSVVSNLNGLTIEETYPGQPPRYVSATIDEAAMRLASEQKLKSEGVNIGTEVTGFSLTGGVRVGLEVSCGPIPAGAYSFSFLSEPIGAVYPYEKLPKEVREVFIKAFEKAKKTLAKADPGIEPGGNPPPP